MPTDTNQQDPRLRGLIISLNVDKAFQEFCSSFGLSRVKFHKMTLMQKFSLVVATYNYVLLHSDATSQEIYNWLYGVARGAKGSFNYEMLAYAQRMNPNEDHILVESSLFPRK